MRKYLTSIVAGLFSALLCFSANASDRGTADEAIAMVKKAAAAIQKDGKEKAFADFSDAQNKTYHDRDLYIFVYDMNGVCVAHGVNQKLVGKSLIDMKDNDGKPIIRGFVDIAATKGKGWHDYKWPNPVTKTVEQKSAYVEKVGDLIVGSGIYK